MAKQPLTLITCADHHTFGWRFAELKPTSPLRTTISVVIPALNEANNIAHVLSGLPTSIDQVILVDGYSEDHTIEVSRAAYPDIVVVRQTRRGKGNALAAGFAAATGDYIVMIDADGSMDPREIPAFIAALDGGAHYAKGSRFCAGGGSDDISRLRQGGNMFLNGVTNLLFGTRFSDLCYGYNAFRRECRTAFALPDAHDTRVDAHWGDGFEIETLINIRVAKAKLIIAEVPSFESLRLSGASNLRTFRDGIRVFATIMRERVSRMKTSADHVDTSRSAVVDMPSRLDRTPRSEAV